MSDDQEYDKEAQKEIKFAAMNCRLMKDFWILMAANTHTEWANLRYVKARGDRPGHRSKKEFDEYKIVIYERHKMFLYRASLMEKFQNHLESDEPLDVVNYKVEGVIQKASRIITAPFH